MSKSRFLGFILKIFSLICLYTVLRIFFFYLNKNLYVESSLLDVSFAFAFGVLFDLSILLLINSVFVFIEICLFLINFPARIFNRIAKFSSISFLIVNIPFILLNIGDSEYFRLSGRRASLNILKLGSDIQDQSLQLGLNYWHVPVLFLVTSILLIIFCNKIDKMTLIKSNISLRKSLIWAFILLVICVLGIRGGLQRKPLSPAHAFIFSNNSLGFLAQNSSFTFIHSKYQNELHKKDFFADRNILRNILTNNRKNPLINGEEKRKNVVVLILESFTTEYMGLTPGKKSYLPFIVELAKKGVYFKENYANGRQSIDAVNSILAGIPSMIGEPYITSVYQGNEIHGLGSVLSERGYRTAFFHGGKNGTMFFDFSAHINGIKEYYGLAEYPEPKKDFDGSWAIFDEPFLQFMCNKLTSWQQPFFATVFTASSHNPYNLPAEHVEQFGHEKNPMFGAMLYADYSVRKFFETASKQPWFKDTIFILTGDHTTYSMDLEYQNELGGYRVPLIFYTPDGQLPAEERSEITQHLDVFPSILNLLNIDTNKFNYQMLPMGHSAFSQGDKFAVNHLEGNYWLASDKLVVRLNGDGKISATLREGKQANQEEKKYWSDILLAYVQYYNNGLIENSWYH